MRMSVPAAAMALAVGLAIPSGPAFAQATAAVFVELNPSTVPAGDETSLRASCDDNLEPATVTAESSRTVALGCAATRPAVTAESWLPRMNT